MTLQSLSDQAHWKSLKVDCVYWHEALNIIDQFLEMLIHQNADTF